ncbi:MAG: nucleotidyltransferase family protein [Candidatus Limivicinus sp.]
MDLKRNTEPALVVMAAGIGSRFGGGIKQLSSVGPNNAIIIDYSVHDAIEAGFKKIVFIIRKEIEKDFYEVIGDRLKAVCDRLGVEIRYAFQEKDDLPEGYSVPEGRVKPWGTCHAILACRDVLNEPFAIINADDYYGKEAYRQLYSFLKANPDVNSTGFCMAGFILSNTLSSSGGVTRGICHMDENHFLSDIQETHDIEKTPDGARAGDLQLSGDMLVSMNMWGVSPAFMPMLKEGFKEFLDSMAEGDIKSEFLLPTYIGQLLDEHKVTVKVLPTSDQWFGITYKEDLPGVRAAFSAMHRDGIYRDNLFEDLF